MIFRLSNIQKFYGNRQVLAIDSLTIERGEIFALVGPSGAGKSTLLRLLAFLESSDQGALEFENNRANGIAAPLDARRRIAMVFQRPLLLNASVRDNIASGLNWRGIHDPARIDRALELVGLQEFASVNARTLSGGEIQRVALARALVIAPDVLLLDEPTANLDPYNVSRIEKIAQDLHRANGATIVLVTHNVFQAKRLATRAGLLLDGHLIEVAKADIFFHSPRDPRTRAFVNGEMIY
ncbi:MAG: ATP-binding cassette domain-containing protein [Chloroflexi bacterium]|nr:ATP-binding cassette domain-containing protein [Chloroflexota bacterium]